MSEVSADVDAVFDELSRELRCLVDLDGRVRWADARGIAAGLASGVDLASVVVPGCCTVMNRESRALGADEFWLKPVDGEQLIRKLELLGTRGAAKVLVIDDEPAARYLIRKFLHETPYEMSEAADGTTGVRLAREWKPDVILLDFLLEQMTAFDVLDQLKADPVTRSIPVIIVTSHVLPLEDRQRLGQHTEAILSKESLSRELAINGIRDALDHAGIRQRAPGRGAP